MDSKLGRVLDEICRVADVKGCRFTGDLSVEYYDHHAKFDGKWEQKAVISLAVWVEPKE